MSESHGTIGWTELMAWDFKIAKEFYAKVCGWTFSAFPGMEDGYAVAHNAAGQPVAGIGDMKEFGMHESIPSHWFSYISVDDIKSSVELIKAAGGEVKREIFHVPNVGQIAIVQDRVGAMIGFVQPDPS